MSTKNKIIIPMFVMVVLSVSITLVSSLFQLSSFVDSIIAEGHRRVHYQIHIDTEVLDNNIFLLDEYLLSQKAKMVWKLVVMGLLIASTLLAIFIPLVLYAFRLLDTSTNKPHDLVHYDALTGIYNRRYFDDNLKRIINSLSRSNGILSLMMIDVDFFKNYNDTYGHNKGDGCLRSIAIALAESIERADDFVARYGGEEFVVVMPNTDEYGARIIANRMLEGIQNCNIQHENNDAASRVTVSIGITTGRVNRSQSGEDYIKRADEMLYKSKRNGRNRYTFASLHGDDKQVEVSMG